MEEIISCRIVDRWAIAKLKSCNQPSFTCISKPANCRSAWILLMFEHFTVCRVQGAEGHLHTLCGGQGAPLLLLHGHPQSHVMWHAVAEELAKSFTVVLMDLRGYGDSERVASDDSHRAYSKRAMALDAISVMQYYGFDTFQVLAHDRGARVAHRLAVDHPDAVSRLMLLDIAPTLGMYEHTTDAFARAYWHWFFLIQPPPLPESLISADPVRYVRSVMGKRHAGLAAFSSAALAARRYPGPA
jgi:haloacetate dehalogenase